MIFDCDYVTGLVERWQGSNDPKILELILEHSQNLVGAIVSGYDSFYREDLIQEVNLRIQYALPYFNKKIANLHTYLTTVSKNICLTYLSKQNKYNAEFSLDIFEDTLATTDRSSNYNDVLEDLVVRNRQRFPSIPVDIIDDVSEAICDALLNGINKRELFTNLTNTLGIAKDIVQTIYISSMLYLRSKHIEFACIYDSSDEFSIVNDLLDIFGEDVGEQISIIFSGMTVKFP